MVQSHDNVSNWNFREISLLTPLSAYITPLHKYFFVWTRVLSHFSPLSYDINKSFSYFSSIFHQTGSRKSFLSSLLGTFWQFTTHNPVHNVCAFIYNTHILFQLHNTDLVVPFIFYKKIFGSMCAQKKINFSRFIQYTFQFNFN